MTKAAYKVDGIYDYLYFNGISNRPALQDVTLWRSDTPPALVGGAVILHGIVNKDDSITDMSVQIQYPYWHYGFPHTPPSTEGLRGVYSTGALNTGDVIKVTYALPLYLYRRDIPFNRQQLPLRRNDVLNVQGEEPFFIALCDVYKEDDKGFRFEVVPESFTLCVFAPYLPSSNQKWEGDFLLKLTLAILKDKILNEGEDYYPQITKFSQMRQMSLFTLRYYRSVGNKALDIEPQLLAVCRQRVEFLEKNEYIFRLGHYNEAEPLSEDAEDGAWFFRNPEYYSNNPDKTYLPITMKILKREGGIYSAEEYFLGYWRKDINKIFLQEKNIKKIIGFNRLLDNAEGKCYQEGTYVRICPSNIYINRNKMNTSKILREAVENDRHRLTEAIKIIEL